MCAREAERVSVSITIKTTDFRKKILNYIGKFFVVTTKQDVTLKIHRKLIIKIGLGSK